MERKALILLVIVVVAAQMTCKTSAFDYCCIRCATRCKSPHDIYKDCYKKCCDCCNNPSSCGGPPPTLKRLDSPKGEKLH